jgi:hypothetical protein
MLVGAMLLPALVAVAVAAAAAPKLLALTEALLCGW